MHIPSLVVTAAKPHLEYQFYKEELAAQHKVSLSEVEEHYTPELLASALTQRTVMESLWPDCPAEHWVYACFYRPASEYYLKLPDDAKTKDQAADWEQFIPWTYIATRNPLNWPDIRLLRRPSDTICPEEAQP